MPRIFLILVIAIVIFVLTYLGSENNKLTKAVIYSGLAAVLCFTGPYIVDYFGREGTTEDSGGSTSDGFLESEHIHMANYEKKENIIDATCFDNGSYDLVSYCKCGEEVKREPFVIEASGHSYVSVITYPSCEKAGFTTYTCSRCGDSYEDNCTEALGHDYVEEICSRCGLVGPGYESLIVSQANVLLDAGKYDEASNLVNYAIELTNSDSLQQLLDNIQAMQDKETKYGAKNADFITHNGSINNGDQTDTYYLTAPVSGYYRFDFSDMVNGFRVKLSIYDSAGNYVGGSILKNDEGVTCVLEKDYNYTIMVMSYSNTGNYTLTIGQQKEVVNITPNQIIYDSIEYIDQRNEYTFIPSVDGNYRFDFVDVVSNLKFEFHMYDSLGYSVGDSYGVGNKEGVTVKLNAGEMYTIKILQYRKLGSFTLMIGKQQPTQDITGKNFISENITYIDQNNVYIYTPSLSGEYVFSLQNMVSGFKVNFSVYDSLNYNIAGYNIVGNDGKVTVKLTAGETYTINVTQYSGTGSYDISISI